MDSGSQINFEWSDVPHPGETVLEYLDFQGWSQSDLARRSGLTPKTISEICNGKAPITPQTALAFEKVFQRPAHLWLNLQRQFDEAEARGRELAKSPQWEKWAQKFPLNEMRKLKFSLTAGGSNTEVLLHFFGVSSPESWQSVWKASAVVYRQTRSFKAREESIAAWVRETELVARRIDVAEFDEQLLLSLLERLRLLSRERVDEALDEVQKICASCGVAVVVVPALQNTGISGCARWLSDKKALVGLTLRYKFDDQVWFTLFHEIGHILLHKNKRSFVLDNAAEDLTDLVIDPEMQQYEMEANRFSADTLIPPRVLEDFIRKGVLTNDSIQDFAQLVGVGPGIVVGRLQREDILKKHQGNKLKQKVDWVLKQEE
jgi:HTH-type transcriptional regulator/antitoxin HigA